MPNVSISNVLALLDMSVTKIIVYLMEEMPILEIVVKLLESCVLVEPVVLRVFVLVMSDLLLMDKHVSPIFLIHNHLKFNVSFVFQHAIIKKRILQ